MKIKSMKRAKGHTKDMSIKHLFRRGQIVITALAVMIAAAGYLNYVEKKDLANGNMVYEAGTMGISDEDILTESQATSLTGQSGLQEVPSLDQGPSDLDAVSDADSVQTAADPGTGAGALVQTGNSTAVEEATQAADAEQTTDARQIVQAGTGDSAQTGLESLGEVVPTSRISVADYVINVQLGRERIRAKNKETLVTLVNSTSADEVAKQWAIQDVIKLIGVSEKGNVVETLPMAKGFSDPVMSITQDKVDAVINASSITDPRRVQVEDIVKRKTEVGVDQIIITLLNMTE